MNKHETISLLQAVAAYDRRTIGQGDIAAWHAALRDLALDDMLLAVPEWFGKRTNDLYTMPHHIRNTLRDMQRAQAEREHSERLRAEALPAAPPNPNFDGLPIPDIPGDPIDAAYEINNAIAHRCPRCRAPAESYCISPLRPDRPQKIPCLRRLKIEKPNKAPGLAYGLDS